MPPDKSHEQLQDIPHNDQIPTSVAMTGEADTVGAFFYNSFPTFLRIAFPSVAVSDGFLFSTLLITMTMNGGGSGPNEGTEGMDDHTGMTQFPASAKARQVDDGVHFDNLHLQTPQQSDGGQKRATSGNQVVNE